MFIHLEKSIFGALIAVLSYLYGCIGEMIIVLSILMIFDYITGVLIAIKTNTFDSNVGIWGIIRKLSYLMIVTTGYLTDITINSFANLIGLDFNTYGALGFAVIFYLIGNEGLSLLSNWIKLNLPVPTFLNNLFINFQTLANSLVKKNQIPTKDVEVIENEKDNQND